MRRFFNHKQQFNKKPRINDQIRFSPIRLIDQNGNNLGEIDVNKARQLAQETGLDLIEIAPQSRPPVCRIMDFGKYQYQQSRKEKEKKQKQKTIEVKSARITPRISRHDLETKAHQAEKFLNQGNRLRIEVFMRGREKAHQEIAHKKLREFLEILNIKYKVEQPIKREPRGITTVITKDETKDK